MPPQPPRTAHAPPAASLSFTSLRCSTLHPPASNRFVLRYFLLSPQPGASQPATRPLDPLPPSAPSSLFIPAWPRPPLPASDPRGSDAFLLGAQPLSARPASVALHATRQRIKSDTSSDESFGRRQGARARRQPGYLGSRKFSPRRRGLSSCAGSAVLSAQEAVDGFVPFHRVRDKLTFAIVHDGRSVIREAHARAACFILRLLLALAFAP